MAEISLIFPPDAMANGKSMRVAFVESLAGRLVTVWVKASAPADVFVAGYAIDHAEDRLLMSVTAADDSSDGPRGTQYNIDFESITAVKVL